MLIDKPKSIMLVGRRWFQKGPGNTYHSVEIYVDGKFYFKIPYAYGYDRHFETTAFHLLQERGIVKLEKYANGGCQAPWQWAQDNGVTYTTTVTDVTRKKDL